MIRSTNTWKDDRLIRAVKSNDYAYLSELIVHEHVLISVIDRLDLLHLAIRFAETPIVELLLTHGADVNRRDSDGLAPLCLAVGKRNSDVIRLLIGSSVDVDAYSQNRPSALYCAAYMGANSICSQLLDAGASVNKKTYMGSTPLFAAVVAGNYNTVDLLINRRADVNVLSGREAPLHIACTLNNAKMVERILQSDGVLIDILDCQRHTPLYYGYRGMEPVITGLLLSAGARIENDYGIDAAREQALSWTVSSGYFHVHPDLKKALVVLLLCYRETDHPFRDLPPELLSYDFDTINRLVASGARVDCYEHGHSAVHWTVRLRWFEGVRLLLQHKADANIASCRRETPLLTALRTMQYGVASLLIAARADVNATTPDGETPLHSAVCSGCGPYICRRLIDAGAAVNLVVKGATLLHDAVVCGHVATLELLLGGGADARAASFGRTPLHEAIRRGNAAAVESLLASDAALVGLVDRQGRAPLEYAYEENKPDIVRRLLLFKEELWERSAAAPHVEEINS